MYKKILVAIDVSREKNAAKLCKAANELAQVSGGEIHLVSVVPDYGMPLVASYFPADAQKGLKKEMNDALHKFADDYVSGNVIVTLRQGKRSKKILDEISRWEPDLVIVGCRQKASRDNRRVLGSFSSSVADRADSAVLIVR